MQAYEEMHEGGSWWIIASHPAHARHETQESGSFTLSRLRSRTPKALRLTALYHQSEHSRGTNSFPLPFPPLDLVLEQPLRCVFQKLISAVAEPEAVRFAAEGQRCSGGKDGIPFLLPLPLRPSAAEPNVPLAFRRHSPQAKASGSLTPFWLSNDQTKSVSSRSFPKSVSGQATKRPTTTHFPTTPSDAAPPLGNRSQLRNSPLPFLLP